MCFQIRVTSFHWTGVFRANLPIFRIFSLRIGSTSTRIFLGRDWGRNDHKGQIFEAHAWICCRQFPSPDSAS